MEGGILNYVFPYFLIDALGILITYGPTVTYTFISEFK